MYSCRIGTFLIRLAKQVECRKCISSIEEQIGLCSENDSNDEVAIVNNMEVLTWDSLFFTFDENSKIELVMD